MRLVFAAVIAVSCTTVAGAQTTPSQDDVVKRLTQYVDSLAGIDQFSGVVVLAKAGQPVFEHAYGYANRAAKQPNTLQTVFNLGSINKIFTQTAIRQLVAAGKIDLNATFAHYLPDYPNHDVANKVTVDQLLKMQAGLGGDIFGAPASGKRADLHTLADFLPLFANEPLLFEPGSKRQYCNTCYLVLGLIIERVSGQSYYDYVRDHIYTPAGLAQTAHYRVDALPASVATGYTRGDEDNPPPTAPLRPNTETLPGIGSSAGGGYSNAHDLLQLLNALRAHQVPEGPPAGLGIAGGAPGINAVVESGLPGGYDVIVMANMDPPTAERVARFARGLLGKR